MPFDLNGLRAAVAAVFVARGWVQAVWSDAPPTSDTTDQTFAFSDAVRSGQLAASTSGGIYEYSWHVRFVRHVLPSSVESPVTTLQEATTAIDAMEFTANWPTNVNEVTANKNPMSAARGDPGGPSVTAYIHSESSRTLVFDWLITATVYEAAPV